MAPVSWQLMWPLAGGEDALIGPQNGGDHRGVGQRTAYQEVNVGVRGLAGCLDLFPCGGAVLILAVAHGLDHVGLVEPCHQGGVRALQIIAVEVDHLILLLFFGRRNLRGHRAVLSCVISILT